MKYLITTKIEKENEDGDVSVKHVFQLKDEEATHTSNVVTFKLFEKKQRLVARGSDGIAVINESVYFDYPKKDVPIPDAKGGNACGRSFPSWEGVKTFSTERQQEERKKANYYTYIFGEVTFPGKKPELVNFRLTARSAQELDKVFDTSRSKANRDTSKLNPFEKDTWPSFLLEMKVKGSQYADLLFSIKESGLSTGDDEETVAEIAKSIQDFNDYIVGKANE
jgi:hypothetical protein